MFLHRCSGMLCRLASLHVITQISKAYVRHADSLLEPAFVQVRVGIFAPVLAAEMAVWVALGAAIRQWNPANAGPPITS